jgi:hypothetical protein
MITLTLTTLSIFIIAGFSALVLALKRAPEGFEDAAGFHLGLAPVAVSVAPVTNLSFSERSSDRAA